MLPGKSRPAWAHGAWQRVTTIFFAGCFLAIAAAVVRAATQFDYELLTDVMRDWVGQYVEPGGVGAAYHRDGQCFDREQARKACALVARRARDEASG